MDSKILGSSASYRMVLVILPFWCSFQSKTLFLQSLNVWIVWKLKTLVYFTAISNNAVIINIEKYCRDVISSKSDSENYLRNELLQAIVSLFLQQYTRWASSLFAWSWSLELAWLLNQAKKARRMSSSDHAASAGLSAETLFHTASLISSISYSSKLRPERSNWFLLNIKSITWSTL